MSLMLYGLLSVIEPPHDKTNKMTVRPTAQSDQSLRCALNG